MLTYQSTHWEVTLLSEIDFTEEVECFDTYAEAQEALEDSRRLVDLKISELMANNDKIGSQVIRRVVD